MSKNSTSSNASMSNLTFSTGKSMRRSISVTLARVTQKYRDEQSGATGERGSSSARDSNRKDTFPEALQDMLLVLQVDARMNIPSIIALCNPAEVNNLAEALMTVYSHENNLHLERLLQWALKKHLIDCGAQPEQLFRGTSLDTKILSLFINRECRPFVLAVVEPFVRHVHAMEQSLEVDPSKDVNDLEHNRKLLLDAATKLLTLVEANAYLIPVRVAEMLKSVRSSVEKKFPEMADRSAGALLFLRLLNPAICAPDTSIDFKETTPAVRRSLILVSKLVQNLANGVLFGEKEEYLLFANRWLKQMTPRFNTFMFDLVFAIRPQQQQQQQQQSNDSISLEPGSPSVEELTSSVRWLHNFFCARRKVLQEKFFPQHFKTTAEGKQNAANFFAQLRRATNNFKLLPQPDMPKEWSEPQPGEKTNLLQRSYNRVKEGVENLSKRSSTTMPVQFAEPQPSEPVIGAPVLVSTEAVAYNPAFSPGRPLAKSVDLSNNSALKNSNMNNNNDGNNNVNIPTLRRGRSVTSNSATVSGRLRVSKKSIVNAFADDGFDETPANTRKSLAPGASPGSRRTREIIEEEEAAENGGLIPMELATPLFETNRSPLKKHKPQRMSMGDDFEFVTPTKAAK